MGRFPATHSAWGASLPLTVVELAVAPGGQVALGARVEAGPARAVAAAAVMLGGSLRGGGAGACRRVNWVGRRAVRLGAPAQGSTCVQGVSGRARMVQGSKGAWL